MKKNQNFFTCHSPRILEIDANTDGQRVDNFLLKTLKGVPKSKIYNIIRRGEVRVNKKRIKNNFRLTEGDLLRVPPLRLSNNNKQRIPPKFYLNNLQAITLLENDDVLLLNKPAGLAVHGGSGQSIALIEWVRQARQDIKYIELVHRLDKETSGCILLAKSRQILKQLHELLRDNGQIFEKRYIALLEGVWKGNNHLVNVPLKKNQLQSGERVVKVSKNGKSATSNFKVLQHFSNCTLVEVLIDTGRTHQIRVHAQFVGHPIVGDPKYGSNQGMVFAKKIALKRMFLHAKSLKVPQTKNSQEQICEAPLDDILQAVINNLQ